MKSVNSRVTPAQAPASPGRRIDPPSRFASGAQGERPAHCSDKPSSGGRGCSGAISRRPVLPNQRDVAGTAATRKREGDVSLLVDHFSFHLEDHRRSATCPGTLHWPGNVRQLRNAIERAQILANNHCITIDDLPRKSPTHRNLMCTPRPPAMPGTSAEETDTEVCRRGQTLPKSRQNSRTLSVLISLKSCVARTATRREPHGSSESTDVSSTDCLNAMALQMSVRHETHSAPLCSVLDSTH